MKMLYKIINERYLYSDDNDGESDDDDNGDDDDDEFHIELIAKKKELKLHKVILLIYYLYIKKPLLCLLIYTDRGRSECWHLFGSRCLAPRRSGSP
jgi:hypothetical protein